MTEDANVDRVRLIQERLQSALDPQQLEIIDESDMHIGHAGAAGGGGHFAVQVVSGQFQGKSSLERHKMIYKALGDAMGNAIHAISINAKTPAEAATESRAL